MEALKEFVEVKEFVEKNRGTLYKLSTTGTVNIATYLDYLSIYEQYESHKHISSITERKKVVATFCKVTLRTVDRAIALMNKSI